MAARKPSKALVPLRGELVTPGHGKGKIKQGGNPGNRGGGAHPTVLREYARKLIEQKRLLERLGRIAEGTVGEIKRNLVITEDGPTIEFEYCEAPTKDQIKAIETLARIGELFAPSTAPGESNAPRVHVYAKQVTVTQHVHRQGE